MCVCLLLLLYSMKPCNNTFNNFISQLCFKYVKPWIETLCCYCMNICLFYFITTCLTLSNKLSFIWFLDTWVNTQIETQLNPCSWYLNQNISTIIMLSFNSPKPIRGLDALTEGQRAYQGTGRPHRSAAPRWPLPGPHFLQWLPSHCGMVLLGCMHQVLFK